jgi:hypothetical protein
MITSNGRRNQQSQNHLTCWQTTAEILNMIHDLRSQLGIHAGVHTGPVGCTKEVRLYSRSVGPDTSNTCALQQQWRHSDMTLCVTLY